MNVFFNLVESDNYLFLFANCIVGLNFVGRKIVSVDHVMKNFIMSKYPIFLIILPVLKFFLKVF